MYTYTHTHVYMNVCNYVYSLNFGDRLTLGIFCCCCSVAKSCPTIRDPMDCSMPGFPVHHQLPEFAQTHAHWVSDCPPTISSSVIPFFSCLHSFPASGSSSESVLHIRWPKYWSFSFGICPSSEYSGLISFTIDWLRYYWALKKNETGSFVEM